MDIKRWCGKYGKWLAAAITAGLFGIAGITLHDMQTAEGTGLYLALCAGQENRRPYDLMVDLAGMLCLFGALLLPCLLAKRFRPDSFLRLFSAYIAFLPVMSTASLVHLLDGTTQVLLRESLLAGKTGTALLEGLRGTVSLLGSGLPVLILTAAALREGSAGGRILHERGKTDSNGRKKTAAAAGDRNKASAEGRGIPAAGWLVLGAALFVLSAAGLLFPALTEQCDYLIRYCLLLYGFVLWEKVLDRYPGLHTWGWLLFGVFALRGIDRMMEVMSVYHI